MALAGGCLVFDERIEQAPDCSTHQECTDRLSAGGELNPARCIDSGTPAARCEALRSVDCSPITGDYLDDRSILIASLLSTSGAQGATNVSRQQAAILAVEQINASNAAGGVLQSPEPGDVRKLVMLSCDETVDPLRAARHIVETLRVPAIVGPNLSQDTLDLTTAVSAPGGTAMFSPTAVASAIATIPDNGLTFLMVPSDIQRVPLMKAQITALETQIEAERTRPNGIKFAVYYREDALGIGTRDGLATTQPPLLINGATLSAAVTAGKARIDGYQATSTNQAAMIASYIAFQPDLIAIVGAPEAVTYFIAPLEAAWAAQLPSVPRPYYIGIDSIKTGELITAVTGNEDLRKRVRGTGLTTNAESAPLLSAFQLAYGQRFRDANGNPLPATTSGMSAAYDAVYTIALTMVGLTDVTGPALTAQMPRLASNTQACAYDATGLKSPCYANTDYSRTLYNNMLTLLAGTKVTEFGTAGRLEWTPDGAKSNGVIEMWCVASTGPKPAFQSSGLTYDVKTQVSSGAYTPCAP
ncbi:MAG: hypothetical protein WKG01_09635 [Kofleriaceae bacterium]